MKILPVASSLALAMILIGGAALGQDNAPQPAAKPAKGAAAKAPVPAAAPTAAPASADEAIARANAYFNKATTMVANFVQLGADRKRLEGRLFVEKPGRMRFEYDPPAPVEIVADGTSVAVRDIKLAKQDLYFIGQTPLKFLLQDHIDLATDTKVLNVDSNAKTTSIAVEDSATFGGTSRITLVFDTATFQLRQWIVLDPQGFETTISLFNVDYSKRPDPALFKINQDRFDTRN
ncbi:MAG: outer-membrane lipoprotein carrier protein LolA [Methylobacteriaceae bacterium]|nr:outer-membrane lipoprotein carrier protein LolA [Methylobacteriaceae bacterium]MBV9634687.1 outer-membrane lipoprotein carrier protein LolA [Methylobacteriaceae bacterium]